MLPNIRRPADPGIGVDPVADWYPVEVGQHYGTFMDAVTSQTATVTRAGAKTIEHGGVIYDVPANYLGLRPRADGGSGLEAVIEEARTNLLKNSYFSLDTNSDGLADDFSSTATTKELSSDAPYGNAQRLAAATAGADYGLLIQSTAAGTVAQNDFVTATVWIRGSVSVGTLYFGMVIRNAAGTALTYHAASGLSPTSEWQKVTFTAEATDAASSKLSFRLYATAACTLDVEIACAQAEIGAFATSYIPTTTAAVTRATDKVEGIVGAFDPDDCTLAASVERPTQASGASYIASVYESANNRTILYRTANKPHLAQSVGGALHYDNEVDSVSAGEYYTQIGRVKPTENMRIFVDGTKGDRTDAAIASTTAPTDFYIGCEGAASNWNAGISRLMVYPYLTDEQVAALDTALAAGYTMESVAPVADWIAEMTGAGQGVLRDRITGTAATVTRAGAGKTCDLGDRLVDVPANTLAVRPRSDGRRGVEAIIEESRTNLCLYSGLQTDGGSGMATGYQGGNGTPSIVTSGQVYGAGCQRVADVSSDGTLIYSGLLAVDASSDYTGSVYIKNNGDLTRKIDVRLVWFDSGNTYLTFDAMTAVEVTTDWVRYEHTGTSTAATAKAQIAVRATGGSGTGDFLIDAIQLEKGAFATSFIPTTTAAVTRAADNVSASMPAAMDGSDNTIAWVAGEGAAGRLFTWYVDGSNYALAEHNGADNVLTWWAGSGSAQFVNKAATIGSYYVGALRGATTADEHDTFVDGASGSAKVCAAMASGGGTLHIGSSGAAAYVNTPIQRIVAFDAALTDEEMAALDTAIASGENRYKRSFALPYRNRNIL